MSRPSPAVIEIAKEFAKRLPPRILASGRIPRSWKARSIIDAATAYDARRRIDANPDQYPNRMGRQQKRWLRRRGLLPANSPPG